MQLIYTKPGSEENVTVLSWGMHTAINDEGVEETWLKFRLSNGDIGHRKLMDVSGVTQVVCNNLNNYSKTSVADELGIDKATISGNMAIWIP